MYVRNDASRFLLATNLELRLRYGKVFSLIRRHERNHEWASKKPSNLSGDCTARVSQDGSV